LSRSGVEAIEAVVEVVEGFGGGVAALVDPAANVGAIDSHGHSELVLADVVAF